MGIGMSMQFSLSSLPLEFPLLSPKGPEPMAPPLDDSLKLWGGTVMEGNNLSEAEGASFDNPCILLTYNLYFCKIAHYIFSSQSLHIHQLHNRLWHRVFQSQMGNHLHEMLVKLRGPHVPRPLQNLRVYKLIVGF